MLALCLTLMSRCWRSSPQSRQWPVMCFNHFTSKDAFGPSTPAAIRNLSLSSTSSADSGGRSTSDAGNNGGQNELSARSGEWLPTLSHCQLSDDPDKLNSRSTRKTLLWRLAPLPAAQGDVKIADRKLDLRRDLGPIELWELLNDVSSRLVAQIFVQIYLLEFIKQCIRVPHVVGVT
jgi:hypothetical protein